MPSKKGSMKGFTQKSGDKRPTKSGAGMTKQKLWLKRIKEKQH